MKHQGLLKLLPSANQWVLKNIAKNITKAIAQKGYPDFWAIA